MNTTLREALGKLLAPLLSLAASAAIGDIGRQVFDIENRLGHEPGQVIDQLRPLQSAARAKGGRRAGPTPVFVMLPLDTVRSGKE